MFSVLAASALFAVCFSRPLPEARIVNGIPIKASDYPWMVSLRQELDLDFNSSIVYHFCGASLIDIDPIIILTAAHCVPFSYNDTLNSFMYTEGNTTSSTQLFADLNRTYPDDDVQGDSYQTLSITDPASIIVHPQWTGEVTYGDDIALIILDDNQTVDGISRSTLPTLPEQQLGADEACCEDGETLTAIGYGMNTTNGEGTETLEQTTLDFLTLDDCDAAYEAIGADPPSDYVDDSVMCVIGDNTDICQGDSGGPIMRLDADSGAVEIVGVTSFGIDGCNSGTPSAYISVAHFIDWIRFVAYDGTTTMGPTTTMDSGDYDYSTTEWPTEIVIEGNITCGETTSFEFTYGDSQARYYLFAVDEEAEERTVRFSNCDTSYDTKLKVWTEDLSEEVSDTLGGCDGDDCGNCANDNSNEAFTIYDMDPGGYIVKIKPFSSYDDNGEYLLDVQCTDGEFPSTTMDIDESDDPTREPTSRPSPPTDWQAWLEGDIACGETKTFEFMSGDSQARYYRFVVDAPRDVNFSNCESEISDTKLRVWSDDFDAEVSETLGGCDGDDCGPYEGGCDTNEEFTIASMPKGTYYVEFMPYDEDYSGNYVLNVQCGEADPTQAPTPAPTLTPTNLENQTGAAATFVLWSAPFAIAVMYASI